MTTYYYLTDEDRKLLAERGPSPPPVHRVTIIDRIRELKFLFDFPATRRVKLLIRNKIKKVLRYQLASVYFFREIKECHVQKFRRLEDADYLYQVINRDVPYLDIPEYPFQIDARKDRWFYLCWIPRGKPFNSDDLFEWKTMYDGKSDALFITEYYKKLIRCLVTIVYGIKGTRVRPRMDMDKIYTTVSHLFGDYQVTATFLRFDVQEAVKDDAFDLTRNLKLLFDGINNKYTNREGSYTAEFDLLFNNYSLKMSPNVLLRNVIFWKKAQRIQFLKKVLECPNNLKIYGEYTEDVFKDVCELKASCNRHMDALIRMCKYWRAGCRYAEELMRSCISIIIGAYENFGELKQIEESISLGGFPKWNEADDIVDFIQYAFPTLISSLVQRAKEKAWPLEWEELETQYCWGAFSLGCLESACAHKY